MEPNSLSAIAAAREAERTRAAAAATDDWNRKNVNRCLTYLFGEEHGIEYGKCAWYYSTDTQNVFDEPAFAGTVYAKKGDASLLLIFPSHDNMWERTPPRFYHGGKRVATVDAGRILDGEPVEDVFPPVKAMVPSQRAPWWKFWA